jgi:hypothetical protein
VRGLSDDPRWLGITNRERIVGTQNDPVRACDIAQKTRRLRFEQHTKCRSTFRHRAPAASALPLVLSRVHWVRPELVAEVKYLTWTDDNLLGRSFTRVCGDRRPRIELLVHAIGALCGHRSLAEARRRADAPWNMQWQTIAEGKAKDATE